MPYSLDPDPVDLSEESHETGESGSDESDGEAQAPDTMNGARLGNTAW